MVFENISSDFASTEYSLCCEETFDQTGYRRLPNNTFGTERAIYECG